MNPLFTEIAASQATSVVGGAFKNGANVGGNVKAITESDNGFTNTTLTGGTTVTDTSSESTLSATAEITFEF